MARSQSLMFFLCGGGGHIHVTDRRPREGSEKVQPILEIYIYIYIYIHFFLGGGGGYVPPPPPPWLRACTHAVGPHSHRPLFKMNICIGVDFGPLLKSSS